MNLNSYVLEINAYGNLKMIPDDAPDMRQNTWETELKTTEDLVLIKAKVTSVFCWERRRLGERLLTIL